MCCFKCPTLAVKGGSKVLVCSAFKYVNQSTEYMSHNPRGSFVTLAHPLFLIPQVSMNMSKKGSQPKKTVKDQVFQGTQEMKERGD